MLLSLERLRELGLLQESDLARPPPFPEDFVDYGPVIALRKAALCRAAKIFLADGLLEAEAYRAGGMESWARTYAEA